MDELLKLRHKLQMHIEQLDAILVEGPSTSYWKDYYRQRIRTYQDVQAMIDTRIELGYWTTGFATDDAMSFPEEVRR